MTTNHGEAAPVTDKAPCELGGDLDPKSTLLCEGGDSWFNGAFTRLPGGARFEILFVPAPHLGHTQS